MRRSLISTAFWAQSRTTLTVKLTTYVCRVINGRIGVGIVSKKIISRHHCFEWFVCLSADRISHTHFFFLRRFVYLFPLLFWESPVWLSGTLPGWSWCCTTFTRASHQSHACQGHCLRRNCAARHEWKLSDTSCWKKYNAMTMTPPIKKKT